MLVGNDWSDGWLMEIDTHQFMVGGQVGQNINLYYVGKYTPVRYRKLIVDNNGNVHGYRTFYVYPVLKPINGTYSERKLETGYTLGSQLFEIVEYTFGKCEWVE